MNSVDRAEASDVGRLGIFEINFAKTRIRLWIGLLLTSTTDLTPVARGSIEPAGAGRPGAANHGAYPSLTISLQ